MKYRLNFKTVWTLTGVRDYINKKGETVKLHEFTDDKGNKHEQKLKFTLDCPLGTKCFVDVDIYKQKRDDNSGIWETRVNITSALPKEEN